MPWKKPHIPCVLLCCAATFGVYLSSLENDFTNWDDPVYVTENPRIRSADLGDLKNHFTEYYSDNYHPITLSAHALQYGWFGLNPRPYHLTSVLIHVLNVILVYVLVLRLFGDVTAATIAALLFGIHPMNVESVAWIAQLKTVLYTLFYLLSLIAYQAYVGAGRRRWGFYALSVAAFLLSVLSKGMAVTLPMTLLVIDYLRRRAWNRTAVLDKLLFFAVSLVFGLVAIDAQGAAIDMHEVHHIRWFERILVAFHGLGTYLYRLLLPVDLSCIHPYPRHSGAWLPAIYYVMPVVVLALGALLWRTRRSGRAAIGLALFFLFSVGTVLQLIPVGKAVNAERYIYVPYIGLFALVGLAMSAVARGNVPGGPAASDRAARDTNRSQTTRRVAWIRVSVLIIFGVYVVGMGVLARQRTLVWKNSETLWTDALRRYPEVAIALTNRGQHYMKTERFDLAMKDFDRSIEANPRYAGAYNNRGNLHAHRGDWDSALADYSTVIELEPAYFGAPGNRGRALMFLGRPADALPDLERAIELNPADLKARITRAIAIERLGDVHGAIAAYGELIRTHPDTAHPYTLRGLGRLQIGEDALALEDVNEAVRLDPEDARAYHARARVRHASGMNEQALDDLQRARRLGHRIDPELLRAVQEALQ